MNLSEANLEPAPRQKSGEKPVVYVVDDDDSVRVSLEWLIRRAGWRPNSFATAGEFLTYLNLGAVCSATARVRRRASES